MSSVWDFCARSSDAVADPDLQISERPSLNFRHFGRQFGLRGWGGGGGGRGQATEMSFHGETRRLCEMLTVFSG